MQLIFFGSPDFALPTLMALIASRHQVVGVVSQPDRPKGRGQRLTLPPIAATARHHQLDLLQPRSVKSDDVLAWCRARNPDLFVVVAFGQILPQPLLDLPHICAINLHASLLPRYRGAAPIQRALVAGDTATGLTTMVMSRKMDAGDILLQQPVSIEPTDTAITLSHRLSNLGPALILRTIDQLESGTATRIAQDESAATYAPLLHKEDGIVDWRLPAQQIVNLVRGLSPWPGALTELGGKPLKLIACHTRCGLDSARPGTILATDRAIHIAAGVGVVAVTELQPAGKRAMSAAAFCAGFHQPLIGQQMGPQA